MSRWSSAALLLAFAGLACDAAAQTAGTCVPASERKGRTLGCYIIARQVITELPRGPLFWYLDTYPDLKAAQAAKGPNGTVAEAYGKIWVFTIAARGTRPATAARVAEIGPLPTVSAREHAAVYTEGTYKPGTKSDVHRHPGAEAWHILEGEMCVETPAGKRTQRAGDPALIVPAAVPMQVTGTGTQVRRSFVLVLQDASLPRSAPASDWKPRGPCT
jgi:quercetin dioxygenase-like cupin family protein